MNNESLNGTGNTLTAKSSDPVCFIGTYWLKVAASTNQVTLPKQLKKAVEEGNEGHLVLVPRDNKKFWEIYTQKGFKKTVKRIRNNENLPEKERKVYAGKLTSQSHPVEMDTQNRFSLPKAFVEKLVETNEVVFEAMDTKVRLWARPDYDQIAKQEEMECQAAINDALDNA